MTIETMKIKNLQIAFMLLEVRKWKKLVKSTGIQMRYLLIPFQTIPLTSKSKQIMNNSIEDSKIIKKKNIYRLNYNNPRNLLI